jgi:hypothetical protein
MPSYKNSFDPVGQIDGYSAPIPFTPSEEDKERASRIMAAFDKAQQAKASYERLWDLYRLYLKGDQLLYRDTVTNEYIRVRDTQGKRLYSINNQLRPIARSLIGKLASAIPSFAVIPATSEQDEVYAARVGDAYFEYFRRREKFNLKYIEMQRHLTWAGNSCVQLYWDPDAGRKLAYCEECSYSVADVELVGAPCPSCEQQLQEAQQFQQQTAQVEQKLGIQNQPEPLPQAPIMVEITEGDAKSRVLDPRNVFPDPAATCAADMQYVIIRSIVSVADIRRRFPHMGMHIGATEEIGTQSSLLNQNYTSFGNTSSNIYEDHVFLHECHEKPSETYPEGLITWVCNGLIMEETPSPYKSFKRLPFFWNHWDRNDGEFWAEPFIQQAWHRQKELNEIETQTRENCELAAHPKILNPIGNHVTAEEISATTTQIVAYLQAVGPPVWQNPPPLPQQIMERRNALIMDMQTQAGVTAQDMGNMGSDPNGRAMAIIEAETDRQVGPIIAQNIDEWGEFYRCLLIMIQERMDPDRQFTIAGDEHLGVYSFRALKNLSEGFDLQLEAEDGLSKNGALRRNEALELLNAGVFNDPLTGQPNLKAFAKMAKIKIPGASNDDRSTEYAAVQAFIKKTEKGIQVQPSIIDDPLIFSNQLLMWLRGPGRKEDADPNVVQTIQQAYQFYTEWAATGMFGGGGGGPQQGQEGSQPGSEQSAPGGTPNNPGKMGTEQMAQTDGGSLQDNAQQIMTTADQYGEAQARPYGSHEA